MAGVSLAQHQLALALALDCQKLVCLARASSPELTAFQRAAEDAGLPVLFAYSPQQLSGLVTANDELIVIREGLFADPGTVVRLFDGGRPVVLVRPVEEALALGFERIDINNADAGVMGIPGALVEQLHQLPADCDIPSSLLRIALQYGVSTREVPVDARQGVNWRLVRSESEALTVEEEWLRGRVGIDRSPTPGNALARAGVIAFGPSMLHAGNASNFSSASALIALLLAVGVGWFDLMPAAFLICGLAWVFVKVAGMLRVAERQALSELTPAIPRADALGWLVDAAIVLLVVWGSRCDPFGTVLSCVFAPATLLLLMHFVPRQLAALPAAWTSDRTLLAIILAIAAVFGRLEIVVQGLALALLVTGIGTPARRQG